MDTFAKREEIIIASLALVSARLWNENHPEDPHSEASLELADDMLDEALRNYPNG